MTTGSVPETYRSIFWGEKYTNKSCIFFRKVVILTYELRTLYFSGASVSTTTYVCELSVLLLPAV
jgi:hypothetical protein